MPKKIISTEIQESLINKLIEIAFQNGHTMILSEMDNDKEKQDKIMALVPDLKKNFLINNIVGIQRHDALKRPWLSILKKFIKMKYNIVIEDYRHNSVRTKRYIIIPLDFI